MTILGYLLGFLGAIFVVLNYSTFVTNHKNRVLGIDRHHSFIPLMGGILGATGFYLITGSGLAPLIAQLDPGCLVLALFPIAMLKQKSGGRKW